MAGAARRSRRAGHLRRRRVMQRSLDIEGHLSAPVQPSKLLKKGQDLGLSQHLPMLIPHSSRHLRERAPKTPLTLSNLRQRDDSRSVLDSGALCLWQFQGRPYRKVIRGFPRQHCVMRAQIQHFRLFATDDPVQRQDWHLCRKAGNCRCGSFDRAQTSSQRHQRTAGPQPPFIEIAHHQCGTPVSALDLTCQEPCLQQPRLMQ